MSRNMGVAPKPSVDKHSNWTVQREPIMSQDKNKLNETTRQNDERPSDTPLPDGVGAAGVWLSLTLV